MFGGFCEHRALGFITRNLIQLIYNSIIELDMLRIKSSKSVVKMLQNILHYLSH
jgi:hypothetical protein